MRQQQQLEQQALAEARAAGQHGAAAASASDLIQLDANGDQAAEPGATAAAEPAVGADLLLPLGGPGEPQPPQPAAQPDASLI